MEEVTRVRVDAREGYDRWAPTYHDTPNPVVALDARHTVSHLDPRPGERILDAGCGTGRNIAALLDAGADVTGVDYSEGMLDVARAKHPDIAIHRASLDRLPDDLGPFDAVLCALVGEHLVYPRAVFAELRSVLTPEGRLVFSAYHPWLAEAGVEANFTQDGTEYRLGAETHSIDDYVGAMASAGLTDIVSTIYDVDDALVEAVPRAAKYLGKPLLVVISARV